MSDDDDMIALIVGQLERLFAARVDRHARHRAERGEWPAALWDACEEMGAPLLLVPEASGGVGLGWSAAYGVFKLLGRRAVPLPLGETMIAAHLLADAGIAVPAGPLAFAEEHDLSAVPWARDAGHLVLVRGGEVELHRLTPDKVTPGANIARDPRDLVDLGGAACLASGASTGGSSDRATQLGAVLRAGQIAGGIAAICEMAIDYANVRVQFGKPIGKFQAVQQSLAVLACEAAAADVAGAMAALALDGGADAAMHVAIAKIRAGEAAGTGAALAHQTHGAIGFTDEHELHDFTRRLWSWRSEYGSERLWAKLLGRLAVERGGDLWAAITEPVGDGQ